MEELNVEELIAQITGGDENVRAEAWQGAGKYGAPAVKPLAKLVTHTELEVGRAAKRAMWKIVRHAGRPGADEERKAVEYALCRLIGPEQPAAVRREALWMLSEIGGTMTIEAVRDLPGILEDKEIREDARCCVERIPANAAVWALQDGLDAAPEDFRIPLAQSLRVRGVEVPGLPCQKLVPTKQTQVKPVAQ